MTTTLTPRLQRAIDYSSQEIFTVLPDSLSAFMSDIERMRQSDMSERDIIRAIFKAVNLVLSLEALEGMVEEIVGGLPQGPVH